MTGIAENIRRLPLVPALIDDEPFPSFIPRLAAEYQLPLIALLEACGFDPGDIRGYGVILGPMELMAVHAATGIPISRVQDMLLMSLHGTVADLSALRPDDGASLRAAARHTWLFFSGSFACPDCLRERHGAWHLRWKTPWEFACVKHSRLMLDTCPECGQGLMGSRKQGGVPTFLTAVPQPGHCTGRPREARTGRAARPCGFPLTEAETPGLDPVGRVIRAQRELDAVLDGASTSVYGQGASSLEYLREARVYASLLLRFAEPESSALLGALPFEPLAAFSTFAHERETVRRQAASEPGTRGRRYRKQVVTVPREAALLAAVLPATVELLAHPEEELVEAVGPLSQCIRSHLGSVGRSELKQRFGVSPTLTEALVRSGCSDLPTLRRRRSQTDGPLARPVRWGVAEGHWDDGGDGHVAFAPVHVPQLLWSTVYHELFAELFSSPRPFPARLFLSLLLVQRTWQTTWQGAAQLLGRDGEKAAMTANGYATRLRHLGTRAEVVRRIDAVSNALSLHITAAGPAVNYRDRERRWPAPIEIPVPTWREICAASGSHVGRGAARRQHAGTWLWSELTGLSPVARTHRGTQSGADAFTSFLAQVLPAIRSGLEQYAVEVAAPEPVRSLTMTEIRL